MNEHVAPYWAVAQVARETLVQTLLKDAGFEVYRPKIKLPGKRTASLFPGYVFVRVIVRWYPIRWTPGVLKVLMAGDRPAKLADAIVSEIKGREVRGFVKLPKLPTLERGQPVRVTKGVFAGKLAIYEGQAAHEREKVLLELLNGGSVSVILPTNAIEPMRA